MNDWHDLILSFLYDTYPVDYKEHKINEFLIEKLGICENEQDMLSLHLVLNALFDKHYIYFEISPHRGLNKYFTLKSEIINAFLKSEGKNYIAEKIRQEKQHIILERQAISITETNESVKATNKSFAILNDKIIPENFNSQIKLTKIYLGLVGLTALFILSQVIIALIQWSTDNSNETELRELKLQGKKLQIQVQRLDSLLQNEQIVSKNPQIKMDTSKNNISIIHPKKKI